MPPLDTRIENSALLAVLGTAGREQSHDGRALLTHCRRRSHWYPDIRSSARFLIKEVLGLEKVPVQSMTVPLRKPERQTALHIDVESLSEEDAEDLLLKKLETMNQWC